MKREIEVTIIFPCYNEEATLANCINSAKKFYKSNGIDGDILVVNNNSTDNSKIIAEKLHVSCIDVVEQGYGCAIIKAIDNINSPYCILSDCDESYELTNLLPFIDKLRLGFDLVIGNRYAGTIEKNAMPWLHRYIGTPVISWLGRHLYKNNIRDYNCGLRAFNTEKIKKLKLNSKGMEFASEMIVKASKESYNICEVPINYRKDKRPGKGHLRTWSDGYKHLKLLFTNIKN